MELDLWVEHPRMTLLIPRAHASVACMGTASSRGLISQGDNRNTPLDALRIKEKNVFVKTLNTAFIIVICAHIDNPLLVEGSSAARYLAKDRFGL